MLGFIYNAQVIQEGLGVHNLFTETDVTLPFLVSFILLLSILLGMTFKSPQVFFLVSEEHWLLPV